MEQKKRTGFTLIEIIIALAIIGILAAVAVPRFAGYRELSQDAAAKHALHQLAKAQEDYHSQFHTYTVDSNALFTASGWYVEPPIAVAILAASNESWSATAKHQASHYQWTFSSSNGGLQ